MEEFKYLITISLGLVLIALNMFFIPFRDKQRCRIQLGINILLLGIILYLLWHVIFICPAIPFLRIGKGVCMIVLLYVILRNIKLIKDKYNN